MEVQRCLKAPKGQYNAFGKYSYRSCEDILDAVKPLLSEQGAALILSDKIECISGRYYVQALARFIDIESGEEIASAAYAREEEQKKGMDGSQITGASSSYARKYALNGLFCIDDNKDSDSANAGQETPQKSQNEEKQDALAKTRNEPQQKCTRYMTKERLAELYKVGEEQGYPKHYVDEAIERRLKKTIYELNQTEFTQVYAWLADPPKKKKEETYE